ARRVFRLRPARRLEQGPRRALDRPTDGAYAAVAAPRRALRRRRHVRRVGLRGATWARGHNPCRRQADRRGVPGGGCPRGSGAATPHGVRRHPLTGTPMRTAARPLHFAGCVELRQTLDVHAHDERELVSRIAEVPPDSIYFHTFGYFLRHHPPTTAYGNDFARWAALEIGDRALAERLAVVDPFAFPRLDALRDHLAAILGDHLQRHAAGGRLEVSRGLHFQRPHILEVA